MKTSTKTDVRTDLITLHEITAEAADCISDLRTAFIYNKSQPIEEYRTLIPESIDKAIHLSTAIHQSAGKHDEINAFRDVPEHILHIWKNINRLYDLAGKKIDENILFSDKAVNESIFLLQRVIEILRPSADIILARNRFLSTYIEESQKSITRNATAYATLHETRLATGECVPAASSIYVSMLEAIKSIAWHTKEIAVALGK